MRDTPQATSMEAGVKTEISDKHMYIYSTKRQKGLQHLLYISTVHQI